MLLENIQHILVYVHSVFLHEIIKPCRSVQQGRCQVFYSASA